MAKGGVGIEVEGLPDLKKLLHSLPLAVNEKIQSDLNQQAAKIVQKTMIDNAPDGDNNTKPGNKIASNIIVRNEKGSKTAKLVGFAKRVWYVKLIEFGTKVRTVLGKNDGFRKGANRGTMTAEPFVAKTHQEAAPKALKFLQENYLKIINNSIRKQAKKLSKGK